MEKLREEGAKRSDRLYSLSCKRSPKSVYIKPNGSVKRQNGIKSQELPQ